VSMTGKIEVITSVQRGRRWSAEEESFGVSKRDSPVVSTSGCLRKNSSELLSCARSVFLCWGRWALQDFPPLNPIAR
jgi:hypothetical protein